MSGLRSAGEPTREPRSMYLALVLMGAQRTMAYPRVLMLSVVSNAASLALTYQLWGAVFSSTPRLSGMDWEHMRTYLVLAQVANLLINASSSSHRLLMLIRTGDIAIELLRPYDVLKAQLALCAGAALVEGVLGLGVAGGLAFTFIDVRPPASSAAAVLFGVSMVLGFLLRFMVSLLISLLCLWTKHWQGMFWMQATLVSIFSGALVPLELYPEWMRALCMALPFQGIIHTPLSIYLGELHGAALLQALGLQALWTGTLWMGARALWVPGVRALDIQGG